LRRSCYVIKKTGLQVPSLDKLFPLFLKSERAAKRVLEKLEWVRPQGLLFPD